MSNKIVQLITLHKNIQGNMQALTSYSVTTNLFVKYYWAICILHKNIQEIY